MDKRRHRVQWGAGNQRSRTSVAYWKQPLKWNAEPFYQCHVCNARHEGEICPECDTLTAGVKVRRRVFCASLADWLDNEVPIEWLVGLLDTIRRTPNLDWLLLTKRIGNWQSRLQIAHGMANDLWRARKVDYDLVEWIARWLHRDAPSNVWIGQTMVNRPEMMRDAPKGAAVPALIHFWSVEPMLGDLGEIPYGWLPQWVICGGESGHDARPMHPNWARSLRDQCQAAGVPFFMKQMGGSRDKRSALDDLPEDLRIRSHPL